MKNRSWSNFKNKNKRRKQFLHNLQRLSSHVEVLVSDDRLTVGFLPVDAPSSLYLLEVFSNLEVFDDPVELQL